jgi:hypothetical protein
MSNLTNPTSTLGKDAKLTRTLTRSAASPTPNYGKRPTNNRTRERVHEFTINKRKRNDEDKRKKNGEDKRKNNGENKRKKNGEGEGEGDGKKVDNNNKGASPLHLPVESPGNESLDDEPTEKEVELRIAEPDNEDLGLKRAYLPL